MNPNRLGCTIFFTGLPGSGKSTIARALQSKVSVSFERPVTVLDGDLVRQQYSPQLGFARHERDLNVRRVGKMAAEITSCGGIAICAMIAPFEAVRSEVRSMVERFGAFVLVHVSTPLDVCEARDPKGLYAKARAGLISQFTGISDPYERPPAADLVIDTCHVTPGQAANAVMEYLERTHICSHSNTKHESDFVLRDRD